MAENVGAVQYAVEQALNAANENWFNTRSRLALMNQYGPAYANPQYALQTQQAEHQRQMTPLQVSGEQQRQNFLAQYYPLQIQAQQTQNVLAGEQAAQAGMTTEQMRGAQQRQQLISLIANVEEAVNQGHDPAQVFDSAVQSASQLTGVPPEKFAQYREQFIRDPKGTIAGWRRSIPATEMGILTPTQRVQLGQQALGTQKLQGEISAQEQAKHQKFLEMYGLKSPQEAHQRVVGETTVQQRVGALTDDVEKALQQAKALRGNAVIRSAAAHVPGTPEYEFAQTIERIKSNTGLQDLMGMKASGFSFGRVAVAEMQAAADAFTNIKPGMKLSEIRNQLERMKDMFKPIKSGIDESVERARSTAKVVDDYFKKVQPPAAAQPVNVQEMASPFRFNPPAAQQQTQVPNPVQQEAIRQAVTGQPTGTGTVVIPPQTPAQMLPGGNTAPGTPPAGPIPGGQNVQVPRSGANTRTLSDRELLELYLPRGR